jgi:hypothetical protein
VASIIGLRTPMLLAVSLIVLFCFLAGFIARSTLAQKLVNHLEEALLSNMSGYSFSRV